MLIWTDHGELVDYPDELIAMMLAAPVVGDQGGYPNLSIEELNCLVHGMLGMLAGEGHTLEQNIDSIKEYCSMMGNPAPTNLEKARAQVKFYNENLRQSEIGLADCQALHTVFPFQKIEGANTVDLVASNIKSLPST